MTIMAKTRSPEPRTGPRPGFEGVVVGAVPVWLKGEDGKSQKYFDLRIEYDDGSGPQRAQSFVRPYRYLPPDTLVRVQISRSGRLTITPEYDETVEAGAEWNKPDIKTGVIALAIGVSIIVVLIVGAFLYFKFSQDQVADIIKNTQPTATPSVTVPATSAPAPTA
jgi:hypothetical protein